eukprot:GILI01009547.1.p1 GENE.GILI01009547.1~~GILI01009547.1.p1  ORF type:complete len:266 (+),score=84.74 GILI01009547.1:22-798(+)
MLTSDATGLGVSIPVLLLGYLACMLGLVHFSWKRPPSANPPSATPTSVPAPSTGINHHSHPPASSSSSAALLPSSSTSSPTPSADSSRSAFIIFLMSMLAFIMSVVWIFVVASELVEILSTMGRLAGISGSIIGITIVAWGNGSADLIANLAIARSGCAAMSVTGCYAGPMFNMLIGLGISLVLATQRTFPDPLPVAHQSSLWLSFFFLFLTLAFALVFVPLNKFTINRLFGISLIVIYAIYLVLQILVENNVISFNL